MSDAVYIHGTARDEQERLAKLGELTDAAFLQFLELPPGGRVLDVGSGLGGLAREVARRVPGGEVWGIERSAEQLARAVADLPNLHFQQGDAHSLPFDDDSFDVAYCRYLLEHVADPVRVLREMRRVLKPGGRVFVQENNIFTNEFDPACPNFGRLWRTFACLQEALGGDALIGKKLFRLLSAAGFRDVRLSIQPEVHHFGSPNYRSWLENLAGNIRSAESALLERGLATDAEIRAAIDDLRRLMDDATGSAFFYWNRATGIKPSSE
ncbi:MAG: methyltransferase domain-containing protein [Gemmataceae bacterium]